MLLIGSTEVKELLTCSRLHWILSCSCWESDKSIRRNKKPKETLKQCVTGGSVFRSHEQLVWRDNIELVSASSKEIMERIYVEQIMSPLLGPKYVDVGMRVCVTREFLESIQKNVTGQRPALRVGAAEVDIRCDSVLLLSDHTLFPRGIRKEEPCIAVEIKISELSEYDPLDLFSRSKERICKAIKALYTTPQNNFCVFLNGSLIFGRLGGGTDRTSFAIGEAFEDALNCVIQADDGLRTNGFIQLVAGTVCQAEIVDRLLEVQKLDTLDIEGAIHAYYNIISQPCKACRELDKEQLNLCTSLHSIPLDESLKILKDYLVATTAKDCSLIVC